MRWKRVDNPDVVDRRGQGGGSGRMSGLPFPMPGGKVGGGGGLIVLLVFLFLVFGRGLLGGDGSNSLFPFDPFPQEPTASPGAGVQQDADAFELVKVVSKDAQDFWAAQFDKAGKEYERASAVIFTSGTQSGCGPASAATGPFYCPLDRRVYLDLGFFETLARQFGAPGDFAQAYVVSHEVAHHVQTLLGVEPEVRRRQQDDPGSANDLSVRMELQADCLAGVWANSLATGQSGNLVLEDGDVEEGIAAAAAVGDDRLGARSPEDWTHGSSELRVEWFRRGLDTGAVSSCNTFSGDL